MSPFMRIGVAALSAMLLIPGVVQAQTTTGVIDGTVRDPDGRPVPGVHVAAQSAALIQKDLAVVSNAEGYFRLPSLPPGTYTVTLALDGFATVERTGLHVNAGQTTNSSVQLTLAALQETVTVSGESPTIDTASAELGFNYTQELLENVPTARSFHNMVSTIPGVETASIYGASPGNLENESVLGAGPFGNRYTMDGGNTTDPGISVNQANLFSYDIIQEVQVLRGAKPAEVGFSQGGYFNVVTKSGRQHLLRRLRPVLPGRGAAEREHRRPACRGRCHALQSTRRRPRCEPHGRRAHRPRSSLVARVRRGTWIAPIRSSGSPRTSRTRSARISGRTRFRRRLTTG